jgi:GT2 family glycosyltransferase
VISAVVPTFHGRERLARNLGSVEESLAASGEDWEIVVVDDGGGGELLAPAQRASVLRLDRNRGYGPAVDAGVAAARGDYLLVLNDDVRLERDCVLSLRAHFPDPTLFAVAPAIGSPFAACGDEGGKRGVWRGGLIEVEEAPAAQAHPTLYAVGCCYLCPRGLFLELGGYDEAFAPYFWEDTDLSYRAWRRGLRVLHDPKAACVHEGSATMKERVGADLRERTFQRNRLLFHLRNLRDPRRRAECLGAFAAMALFESLPPRRAGLLDGLRAFAAHGRSPDQGLSDEEILRRASGP